MKKILFVLLFFIIPIINTYSQKIIEMEYDNGVYYVPCKVNGIPMKFIFDTGASDVTISLTEARFLFKQGVLKDTDFKESVKYQLANGDIQEGTKIIIREINIDGIILNDVEASIVHELNAPLLLGQSAISKLGEIQLDGSKLKINPKYETDSPEFLNIDFTKNYNEYNNIVIELKLLPVDEKGIIDVLFDLEDFSKDNNHFLNVFNFEKKIVRFDKDGDIYGISLSKKSNDVNTEFNELSKVITDKYGERSEYGDNSILWKKTFYNIFITKINNNEIFILCINKNYPIVVSNGIVENKDNQRESKNDTTDKSNPTDLNDFANLTTFEVGKKLAEEGNPDAQFMIAYAYLIGDGTLKDTKQAFYWFKKSAEQGEPTAQSQLGQLYFSGEGTIINKEKAFYWYKKSAEQGDSGAQYGLGKLYFFGNGTIINKEQAFYWYKKSAEQGEPAAQNLLAYMYLTGDGTLKDTKQAFYWYKKSAEQGDPSAQHGLGILYFFGKGTAKSEKQSAYWIRKAYENGKSESKIFWEENELWKYE